MYVLKSNCDKIWRNPKVVAVQFANDNIAHIAVQLQPNDRVKQLCVFVLIIQIVLHWAVGRSAQINDCSYTICT